jgi:hypothetical protein
MAVTLGSSLPSIPVLSVDIPEVTNFKTEFVYGFFSSDELTNESGGWVDSLGVKHSAKPGAEVSSIDFSKNSPRYIHLTWDKVNISSDGKQRQEFVDISIEKNAAQIVDEDHIDLKYYDTYEQQEIDLVTQTQAYLDKLYSNLNYNPTNASLNDAARAIHESTPEPVSQKFINKYLNYSHSENITVNNQRLENPAEELSQISTILPVRNKTFGNLLHEKVMNDSLTPLDSSFVSSIEKQYTNQQIVSQFESRFNGSEYDLYLENPIQVTVAEDVTDFGTVFQTTGYVIERYRLLPNGQKTDKRTFYIENPDTVEYLDTFVAYNQTYIYTIKAVAAVQTLSYSSDERVNVVSTFLVASKKTRSKILCTDTRPPSPPTDFFVRWDYSLKKPVLTWNFPNDTRRHIKYFQVYRRQDRMIGGRSIRPAQLPFELVRMYDFNDLQGADGTFFAMFNGGFRFQNGHDNINISAVMNPRNTPSTTVFTPTSYIDEEFNKESYYIYSIVAVDAHGIASNYSNQIGIKWNKLRNTIDRVEVSAPNAPLPYPNLYIDKDAFVDTIKNEGYSQVTIVFNPEYYDLYKQTGENLQLFKFGPDNYYRLQLINTDLQEDQFIDITVSDQRNS